MNKSKKIIIIVISICILAGTSYFFYQWWRVRGELQQTGESLIKQLPEIKGEIKSEASFVRCREIKARREDLIDIYLLGALIHRQEGEEGKHFWDLFIINPTGDIIGSGYPLELSDMWQFSPIDEDEDGIMDRMIGTGFNRKIGDYLIMVIPQQDVSLSNTYSLRLTNLVLAKNIPYSSNLFDHLYVLRQTETGIIPIVPASAGCRY